MSEFKQRQSGFQSLFKPSWDYNYDSLERNIIRPTINFFTDPQAHLRKETLQRNNNNLSHTHRLGLIAIEGSTVRLTELGKNLLRNDVSFDQVLQQHLIDYHISNDDTGKNIFPYRAFAYILDNSSEIRKIDFLYAIYPLVDTEVNTLNNAIEVIKNLQDDYPDSSIDRATLSFDEKNLLLEELNDKFNTAYTYNDLWTSQTTVTNRLNYFVNHLSVFNVISRKNQTIQAFRLSSLI